MFKFLKLRIAPGITLHTYEIFSLEFSKFDILALQQILRVPDILAQLKFLSATDENQSTLLTQEHETADSYQ